MQLSDSLRAALDRARGAPAADERGLDLGFWLDLAIQLVQVALLVALAVVVLAVVGRLRRRWVRGVEALPVLDPRRQRALTVSSLIGSAARYVVWLVVGIMALDELGFAVGPLIASAGVAGLAIGFGAQTLVKDVISGVFLLFDNTLHVGDDVRIGTDEGTVEFIGLRLIKVRKFNGELLMVPAGELRTFGNRSIGFARVVVPVQLPYERDVDEALEDLRALADAWAEGARAQGVLLEEPPEVQAVLELGESAVKVQIVAKVRPGEQWAAERELRRLVKKRLDERGQDVPFPRRTVYVRQEGGGPPLTPGAASAAAAAGA